MRSIGELARDSGLSVSALRFYDGAGVLVPAWVDPVSGYRWYDAGQLGESRLLARLRRAGMPLADIRLVLAGWSSADTGLVRKLLQAHLRRLELGLSDARSEFSAVRALLEFRENPMPVSPTDPVRLTVSAPELAAALDAVRFAVSTDPELPMLGGVLFDIEGNSLQVVATDRYRLALAVDGDRVALMAEEGEAAGQCLDHAFPDYRRLVRVPEGRRVLVEARAFRQAIEAGPVRAGVVREQDGASCDLSVLKVAADGVVTVSDDGDDEQEHVAVNREFLLNALAAGARDQLILEFGAPTTPLAIRRTDADDTYSLLMPVRLDN